MIELTPSQMRELTPEWTGERDENGRPMVRDSVLERLRGATAEHIWQVLDANGYMYQFSGGWQRTNDHPLVGRAVTAQFLPIRPDLDAVTESQGRKYGHAPGTQQNAWVVDMLGAGDVMVVDIFGKVLEGTVIGDILGSSVAARTGAGAVIDGGVRDLRGLRRLETATFLYRETDPTPIKDVLLAGVNVPVRIGLVTCVPGDVVVGSESGVTFIPAHLAEAVADAADEIDYRDTFGKQRIAEGVYTASEVDIPVWEGDLAVDYEEWKVAYVRL